MRPKDSNRGKSGRRSSRAEDRSDGEFVVEGISAVMEYVRFRREAVRGVFCRREVFDSFAEKVAKFDLKPQVAQPEFAEARVWARVRLTVSNMMEFDARTQKTPPRLILALDHISDPRNLGAIMRSAAFFGVREIFVPERRQVLLTQASVATAQGGFAYSNLVVVVNLVRALEQLKERGYWIIGSDMAGESMATLASEYDRVVLVLGAEDTGMSQSIRKACDRIATIQGARDSLDSLNVSVAAGILLNSFAHRGA